MQKGNLVKRRPLKEDATINTELDSPYNIYKNTGLMPGPVDNPGVSAIEAAVNPSKTDYLYFVANVENGEVFFAKTYEEHNKNVEEHVNSKLTQAKVQTRKACGASTAFHSNNRKRRIMAEKHTQ